MINRDTLFWSAVGALAVGTALLTAHSSLAAFNDADVPAAAATPHAMPQEVPTQFASPKRASMPRPTATASQASRASRPSAPPRDAHASRAEVREALAELVAASRARSSKRPTAGSDAELDPATRMPLSTMTFEQYRVWAKLGRMMAERDYRAVAEYDPPLNETFDSPTVEAMLDAVASDYEDYLNAITERGCEGIDPASLWRKTAFMSLWLGKIERYSPQLAQQELAALDACGY